MGGLEVATTEERWQDLHRKHGWAESWGVEGELVDAARCAELWPLLDRSQVLGGFHVPTDGLAAAVSCCETQARRAIERGARFLAGHTVVDVRTEGGRVTGVAVETAAGYRVIEADVVVCAAGFWGPAIGAMAGLTVPLQPLAHQYAKSGPLAGAGKAAPSCATRTATSTSATTATASGVGSYAHRPMPVAQHEIGPKGTTMPSVQTFTEEDFDPAWRDAVELLPALRTSRYEDGINGIFSFTPDGFPLIGEAPELDGFWLAEAVWVTHSAGVARAVAELLVDGHVDLRPARVRAQPVRAGPARPRLRRPSAASRTSSRSTTSSIRCSRWSRRGRCVPAPSTCASGSWAVLPGGCAGWERPHWFEANAPLLEDLVRGARRESEPMLGTARAGVGRPLLVADRRRRVARPPGSASRSTT